MVTLSLGNWVAQEAGESRRLHALAWLHQCTLFAQQCAPPDRKGFLSLAFTHVPAVFEKAGVQSGALASAAVGATNVLGTVVAAGLMDKAGRK